jgi:hypothetical protein
LGNLATGRDYFPAPKVRQQGEFAMSIAARPAIIPHGRKTPRRVHEASKQGMTLLEASPAPLKQALDTDGHPMARA